MADILYCKVDIGKKTVDLNWKANDTATPSKSIEGLSFLQMKQIEAALPKAQKVIDLKNFKEFEFTQE